MAYELILETTITKIINVDEDQPNTKLNQVKIYGARWT
jgi:hypothetical protein